MAMSCSEVSNQHRSPVPSTRFCVLVARSSVMFLSIGGSDKIILSISISYEALY